MSCENPTNGRYAAGCRCDGCTTAHREYHRQYRQWKKYGKPINTETKKTVAAGPSLNRVKVSIAPLLQFIEHESDGNTAARLGVLRTSVVRWKRDGVSINVADRLACRVGVHPYIIWGNDYFRGMP